MTKQLTIAFLILSIPFFAQTSDKRGTIKVKKVETADTIQSEVTTESLPYGGFTSPVNGVFAYSEVMPSFPGGDAALRKFVSKNVIYPKAEKEVGISGTVIVNFVVEADGRITNVKILKSVTGGSGLDMEALRVILLMPKWDPGKNKGQAVRVRFNLPINFRLK